jgi:hypothetical protein
MATQDRDDSGHFTEKVTEQDLLKAFDFETTVEDPYLTVSEVTDALAKHWEIDVTGEAVRARLEQMRETDQIAKRDFGSSVAYRALVAPKLSDEVLAAVEETRDLDRDEYEAGELTSHEEMKAKFGIDD